MSNQQQVLPAEAARTVLQKFFNEVRLARATELAQSDRFTEAKSILMENGNTPINPRELDLLARIAARQARFEEARSLWQKASEIEPANESYKECLQSLTFGRRIGRIVTIHEGKLWNLLIVAVVLFVAAVLFFVFRK